jgi:hypothetical protein
MVKPQQNFARRDFLKLGAAAAALGVAHGFWPHERARSQAKDADVKSRKLLFVVCAHGGASIIDSFLPVLDRDAGDKATALNCFPERLIAQPAGSAFRCVKQLDNYSFYTKPSYTLEEFVMRHGQDMAVVAHDVSSVNHVVGQQRSLNGAGIDRGRTIMESAALRYGASLPLPNCNMAIDGYARHGSDASVPSEARHELIMAPQLFAAGTHGYRGVKDAPGEALVTRARKAREDMEKASAFGRRFGTDSRLAAFLSARSKVSSQLEEANLIEKLLLVRPDGIDPSYGLNPDGLAVSLRDQLPELDNDPIQAQTALAFLLGYHGVAASTTIGLTPSTVVLPGGRVVGAPLSFDFSHNSHRETQGLMWARTLQVTDALITLLKSHDYLGDPALGKMWDRSLVYIATEFGRDKQRPSGVESWGTGHDLNNGSVMLSKLIKGNAVYGGVDPSNCLTYGFDPVSGKPDKGSKLSEGDVYNILADALDIDVPGGKRFPAIVRGA